ncbi:hypothetical protein ACFVP3_09460 [Streptomyces sp. NPDC057806]|uniref:hypothetical protein n=1 Tax=Streptomyces sp. NPDC057806 TaxID=3346255 RepID=UPI00369608D5
MGAVTGKPAPSPPETDEDGPQGKAAGESGEPRRSRSDRAGLLIAGAALAACTGLVLYGVLGNAQDDTPPERRVPTASVTYEVTGDGTADISYQARSESSKAVTIKNAALPWRKTVAVPLGREPVVSIVLGEHGGQARCTLTIRGQYVQGATASGAFGRATCTGSLPPSAAAGDSARK